MSSVATVQVCSTTCAFRRAVQFVTVTPHENVVP